MELADGVERVAVGEIRPHADQEVDQMGIRREILPEGRDGAVVIGPERAAVAGAPLSAAFRVIELAYRRGSMARASPAAADSPSGLAQLVCAANYGTGSTKSADTLTTRTAIAPASHPASGLTRITVTRFP